MSSSAHANASPPDRIALVTGGARGLGLETCRQLARLGIHVIVAARSMEAAERAVRTLRDDGGSATALRLDIVDEGERRAAFERIDREFGRLDVLINNAGVLLDGPDAASPPDHRPSETPREMIRETFETNVFAPFFLIQTLLPLLRRSTAPRIVNLSSTRGSLGMHSDPSSPVAATQMLAYDSSKTALNAVTVLLAAELREGPIKINAIHPGWVRTEMGGGAADLGIEDGARTAVLYATLADDGPTGGFFHLDERLPW